MSSAYQKYTDTTSGTYWCTAVVDRTPAGLFSVTVGVPLHPGEVHARTRDEGALHVQVPRSRLSDLAIRWDGLAWSSARVHSHLLAAMPPGVFPGVDDTEVLKFLERHGGA